MSAVGEHKQLWAKLFLAGCLLIVTLGPGRLEGAEPRRVMAFYYPWYGTADGPGGEKVAIYVEGGSDHLAHAENYCTIASKSPPVRSSKKSVERRWIWSCRFCRKSAPMPVPRRAAR